MAKTLEKPKNEAIHLQPKGFLAFRILHELRRKKLCGDELAEIIGKNKGSKLTPGTIYPALKFLRKRKLVQQKRAGRKKLYCLTPEGETEYKIFKKHLKKLFEGIFSQ